MKKLLSFFAIACGVVLFASCESSEAITRNLLEHRGYNYNLAYAAQFVDEYCQDVTDTLVGLHDGDTVYTGRFFRLELYTPGIAVDTTEYGDTVYTYPADKRFALIGITLLSPGLDRICEGTYEINDGLFVSTKNVWPIPSAVFFQASNAIIFRDTVGMDWGPSTKVADPYMFEYTAPVPIDSGTVEVKRGMMNYDIIIDAKDYDDNPVHARYTGIVPKRSFLIPEFWLPL